MLKDNLCLLAFVGLTSTTLDLALPVEDTEGETGGFSIVISNGYHKKAIMDNLLKVR